MPVVFAGQPCRDPRTLYVSCRDQNLSTDWADKPNAFACPLGCDPGEGWLLLAKSSLDAISPDGTFAGLYDLTFGDAGGSVPLKNLVVVSGKCLTPGVRGGDSAYLVRVADRRWFLKSILVDAAYNMRDLAFANYLPRTVFDYSSVPPVPWSWAKLAGDLWARGVSVLGAFPGLPFAPDGTPGDVEIYQRPLSEALGGVLERLGCALRLDPTLDTFSIIRVGVADPVEAAATQRLEAAGLRVWDEYSTYNVRAGIPEMVRVLFRKVPHHRDGTSPYYALDVADVSPAPGTQPGTLFAVEDELEVIGPASAAATNAPALAARAAERAADAFRRLKVVAAGLRVVYAGVQSDPGILPGPLIDSTRWSEMASGIAPTAGLITEVVRAKLPGRGEYPSVTRRVPGPIIVQGDNKAVPAGLDTADGGLTLAAFGAIMAVHAPLGLTYLRDDQSGDYLGGFELILCSRNAISHDGLTSQTPGRILYIGEFYLAVPTGISYAGFPIYIEASSDIGLTVMSGWPGGVGDPEIGALNQTTQIRADSSRGMIYEKTQEVPGNPFRIATIAVSVANSVTFGPNWPYNPNLGGTQNSIQLVGDVNAPGNNMVYGTNALGAKGWQSSQAAAPPAGALTGTYP